MVKISVGVDLRICTAVSDIMDFVVSDVRLHSQGDDGLLPCMMGWKCCCLDEGHVRAQIVSYHSAM